jgi:carboxylate-amine ligase
MIRPSLKHPTLELRAPDCPTLLEDSIAIAALWRSLARRLVHNPELNRNINAVGRAIVVENKWRAQRYGVHGTLIGHGGAVTVADWVDQIVEETTEDAEALGCLKEMQHCRTIARGGSSADRQLEVFEKHSSEGRAGALRAVSDWVAEATLR